MRSRCEFESSLKLGGQTVHGLGSYYSDVCFTFVQSYSYFRHFMLLATWGTSFFP